MAQVFRFISVFLVFLAILGCSDRESVPEGNIHLVAENRHGTALRIIRQDPFPWTEVTFTINRLFHYHREVVEEEELLIPYEWFRRQDGTAYIFDPSHIRLKVTANEGTWRRETRQDR